MAFNNKLKINQFPVATTALTGAAPQIGAGNSVPCLNFQAGTQIAAAVVMGVTTSGLIMTPSWQGSQDGSTWETIVPMNNAANVATAAGTGSTVTTSVSLLLQSPPPYRFVRLIVTTSAAVANGTTDTYAIKYHFVAPAFT